MTFHRAKIVVCALTAVLVAVLSTVVLERQRADLSVEQLWLANSPVTLWRAADNAAGPLVVVAHGYAGSRQMMQALAIELARAGFVVAAFDFHATAAIPSR